MAACSSDSLLVANNRYNLSYLKQKGKILKENRGISGNYAITEQPGLRKGGVKASPGTAVAVGEGPSL